MRRGWKERGEKRTFLPLLVLSPQRSRRKEEVGEKEVQYWTRLLSSKEGGQILGTLPILSQQEGQFVSREIGRRKFSFFLPPI